MILHIPEYCGIQKKRGKVEVEDKQEIKGSKSIQKMKRIGCHVKSKRVRVEQIDHQRAFTIHPLMTHKANHQSKTKDSQVEAEFVDNWKVTSIPLGSKVQLSI